MKITVLGTGAAYPSPGDACSGFLVEDGNTNLLVECGIGVVSNLQKYLDLRSISAIFITHMHADHFFDLVPYRYALRYGLDTSQSSPPRLYLPPGGAEALNQVVSPFAESPGFFSEAFDMAEFDTERPLQVGNLTLNFVRILHYIPAYGVTITGAKKLAYSSDSGSCPGLLQVARSADLFLCNAGDCLEPDQTASWGHLKPCAAGELAREAGVKRLLLSHLWPECDHSLALQKASEAFGGSVELAQQCHTYEL